MRNLTITFNFVFHDASSFRIMFRQIQICFKDRTEKSCQSSEKRLNGRSGGKTFGDSENNRKSIVKTTSSFPSFSSYSHKFPFSKIRLTLQ